MRYRLPLLTLIAVMPVIYMPAAPVPERAYAILDIGPPPKGKTAEQYRRDQMRVQTDIVMLTWLTNDPKVSKLASIAPMKDPRPWLAKNLQVSEERRVRRLRLVFLAGSRAEQVTILNALLRTAIAERDDSIKYGGECIRFMENEILDSEEEIKATNEPRRVASLQEGIQYLRTDRIPLTRDEITRLKQITVTKWAR